MLQFFANSNAHVPPCRHIYGNPYAVQGIPHSTNLVWDYD